MTDRVTYELSDGIAHVRLNRPEKKNALDGPMFAELLEAARRAQSDRSLRAVVLSGEGDCFCSGLDFSTFGDMASGALAPEGGDVADAAADLSEDGAHRGQQIAWLWQEVPVPVIAAVQGAALGGGFHIALGADIRIVAPDARIGFVEITWGLVPDLSGTQALRRLVPLDLAKRLIFTGDVISGEQAVARHLATELSERYRTTIRGGFLTVLERAAEAGEIDPDLVDAYAATLGTAMLGLSVAARGGASEAELHATLDSIIALVRSWKR